MRRQFLKNRISPSSYPLTHTSVQGSGVSSGQNQESCIATRQRVKCSDSLFRRPTTATSVYAHIRINTMLPTTKHHTLFPSLLSPSQPASQPAGPPSSLLSHRHKADTNVTLWKIITNKRTADCKQLAPLSGLSLVISLNPGRGQDH